MTQRCRSVTVVLALCALLAGCATTYPTPLVPALFPGPQTTVTTKDAGPLALTLANPDQQFRSPSLRYLNVQVEMPIGRIVEAAAMLALREQFEAVAAGPGDDARALRLQVSDIVPDLKTELIYLIPLPYVLLDRVDVTARLGFRLSLRGSDGSVRWARDYDSGRELVKSRSKSFLVLEPMHEAIQRVAHEQSARLMRQAAGDLRVWLEQERRRERVL